MAKEPAKIRKATAADLAAIKSCARAAYAKYIDRIGREPAPMIADFAAQIRSEFVHVAVCNNTIAGYVVFYRDNHCVHLENVAVVPEYCGRGIGGLLINFVEQSTQHMGVDAVELYTNEAMTENLNMYPALGYVEIDRKLQDGFNRVFFRKTIPS